MIRNITGTVPTVWRNMPGAGSFENEYVYYSTPTGWSVIHGYQASDYSPLRFNANGNSQQLTVFDNPMAGHAAGSDIHPHNLRLIPLIAY